MPYIKDIILRKALDQTVLYFLHVLPTKKMKCIIKGNLNYFLFKLAKVTCNSYSDYSDFIGELESCKLEIYRRLVAPYEDKKIEENGDVA